MAKAPIKILHVVFSLEPGGMENGLVNVARGINQNEFEVHVSCLERGGSFVERLPHPARVSILHKPSGFSWKTVRHLARDISRISPDIIHTHNLGPLIYSSLATCFGTTRCILHGEHGLPYEQCTPRYLRQRRWFYRCCRMVHTVSTGLRERLTVLGLDVKKVVVLLNGVDTERFFPAPCKVAAREKISLMAEGPVIGVVGRFDRDKRHSVLIEAFLRLVMKMPTAQLLIVGDGGSSREQVHQQIRSSPASNRIHLAGFQKEPQRFYQAMDLLVLPSINEGLSNVVLEAMACGIPVLAHDACGNSEMIQTDKNSFLADLRTSDQIYDKLIKILGHTSAMGKMGEMARNHVVENFSIHTMVQRYEAVYRQLANRTQSVT